jgi:hypothetical protein
MKNAVIILLSISFIVIPLLYLIYPKNDNDKDNQNNKDKENEINNLTQELYENLDNISSHPSCQDSTSNQFIKDINDIKEKGNSLLSSNDPPSPSSIVLFKKAIADADDVIKNIISLPSCDIFFCPQGTYKDGNCTCPASYPYPIVGEDGKTYCFNMSCPKMGNNTFIPGSDSSKNLCNCNSGYAQDSTNPTDGTCYNVNNTNNLNSYIQQINEKVRNLQHYLSPSHYSSPSPTPSSTPYSSPSPTPSSTPYSSPSPTPSSTIYKTWISDIEDGTIITFYQNNSVTYQNCYNNLYVCSSTLKTINGNITNINNNNFTVTYSNYPSVTYEFNPSNNTLKDLSNGTVFQILK